MNSSPHNRRQGCRFCELVNSRSDLYYTNDYISRRTKTPLESTNFVVVPDAAPLTTFHILAIPRSHKLSVAQLCQDKRSELLDLSTHIKGSFDKQFPNQEMYYFEHGSSEKEEVVGCGITHAHFHLMYSRKEITEMPVLEYFRQFSSLQNAWNGLNEGDYYLLGRFNQSHFGTNVEESAELKCNMFLRKHISSHLNKPQRADYLRYKGPVAVKDDLVDSVEKVHKELASMELHLDI